MSLLLFYDTETTGLPNNRALDNDASQPHLVQLAAHLVDADTRKVVQSIDLITHPTAWQIPAEVSVIHGITQDYAAKVGIEEWLALKVFMSMWDRCDARIAHNEEFDAKIIRIGAVRYLSKLHVDKWGGGKAYCTSDMTQQEMNLPPTERMRAAGRFGPRKPRMAEAYRFYTGKELFNAHTAIADVNACMEVYWAVTDRRSAEPDAL